jgi:hypothetical protein
VKLPLALWLVLTLGLASVVTAQDREISAMGGVGYATAGDFSAKEFAQFGASFSFRAGRPEIKVDYEHVNWDRPGNLHIISFGWLIQKRSGTVRPLFQWGFLYGLQRQHFEGTISRPDFPPIVVERTTYNHFTGAALSAGLSIDVQPQIFIRPEFRWKFIAPDVFMLNVASVGVGYRF